MHSGLPAKHRRWVITALASAWALSGAAGISAVIASPNTIIAELGRPITLALGILLISATTVAVVGVVAQRYWLEWVASWGSSVALMPYLVTVWALAITGETTRMTQGFLVTSLLAFYLYRSASCAAHAAKLRIAHEASTAITESLTGPTPTIGGDARDDDVGAGSRG